MIVFDIIIVLVAALLFYKVPAVLKAGFKEPVKIMDKDSTLALRGAAIIGIVLHHLTQYYSSLGLLALPIRQAGYALTAIFFLFSGYGCYYSLKKYSNQSKPIKPVAVWAVNHSLRLVFDFLIVFVVNIILFKIVGLDDALGVKETVKNLFTITLPTWVSWYPKIQILCYVLIAVTFLISKKYKEWITLGVSAIYILVMWRMGIASMWYSSVICFPLGMLYAKYIPKLNLSRVKTVLISAVSLICFAALFVLQMYKYTDVLRTMSTVFLSLFIVSLTGLYHFDNALLKKIGNMSFEIYLIHLVLIKVFSVFNLNSNIAVLAVMLITLAAAYPINKLVTLLNNKIFRKNFNEIRTR